MKKFWMSLGRQSDLHWIRVRGRSFQPKQRASGSVLIPLLLVLLGLGLDPTYACASMLPAATTNFGLPAGWAPPPQRYGMAVQRNWPITMDDGVVLYADVYVPTDLATGKPATGSFPVIVTETPYGKDNAGALGAVDPSGKLLLGLVADDAGWGGHLVKRGYIDVIVDVRGNGMSGGQHTFVGPRETKDAVNIITWAARLPNSNGKIGMIGESYLGITQFLAAQQMGHNSPIKAIFPIFPGNDAYRELINNDGLYNLAAFYVLLPGQFVVSDLSNAVAFLSGGATLAQMLANIGRNTNNLFKKDGVVEMAINVFSKGEDAYAGPFWDIRSVRNTLSDVVANGTAVYLIGGLFDVFQTGDILSYSGLQNAWAGRPVGAAMRPDQPVSSRYQLLYGPWYHLIPGVAPGLVSNIRNIQIAWFDRWLKGIPNGIDQTQTPLHIIDQDLHAIEASHYPLVEAPFKTYYLGRNSLNTPKPTYALAFDALVYTGFENLCSQDLTEQWAAGLPNLFLYWLKTYNPCAAQVQPTPGILKYVTTPFTQETVLAGPIGATLYVATSSTDMGLLVHLDDVAPDGRAREITSGSIEGTYRALDTNNTWYAPNGEMVMPYHALRRDTLMSVPQWKITRYDIMIQHAFWTFQPGHTLRLRIGTGDFPHLLPPPWNLSKLMGFSYIQRTKDYPSRITVPLAPASAFVN